MISTRDRTAAFCPPPGATRPLMYSGSHDVVSALIAERARFDGIWVSSLGVSTSLKGLPDESFLTMHEMYDVARNIANRVRIPVIVDCDSGYGNDRNVAHAVIEFESCGVSGVCIEDNVFPKRNSFYRHGDRPLVPAAEMERKIYAGKAASRRASFGLIARTEALIAGRGIDETLSRGRRYAAAGADAVIMHSLTWDDARRAGRAWSSDVPLIVIPTKFGAVSSLELFDAGFRIVIYANQALRAGIDAMSRVLEKIAVEGAASEAGLHSLEGVEDLVRSALPPPFSSSGAKVAI
jgi:phosphoenolpyruvate phosphomutase